MLLNSQALPYIQITCPAKTSMHRSVVTSPANGNSNYKVIKLSDITLKDLVELQGAVAKLPSGNVAFGVSCVQDFGKQDLQSSLGRTLLASLKKGPFGTVLEQGPHPVYSSELVGASNAKALLKEIIRCVGQDLEKSSGIKLPQEAQTTPLGALVNLDRTDLVSAGKSGYSPTKSVDDPQVLGDLQREMSAGLSDIVGTVHLTTARYNLFGDSFDMKPLADMTLPQLETHLATMKSQLESGEPFRRCGVSSASVEGQATMQKLGIQVAVGEKNNSGIVSGSGRDEMQSLERIMKMLRGAALACADERKIADPEKTKVGELAVTYLKDTPAGQAVRAIVSQAPAQIGGGGTRPLELTQTERTATNDNDTKGLSNG